MRITRKEDIAMLLVAELSDITGNKYIPLSQIGERHGISTLFLKKLALMLRRHNLLISKEGMDGGYRLKKSPDQISLYEVMEAVNESKQNIPDSILGTSCPLNSHCLPQSIRSSLERQMTVYFQNIKLDKFISNNK